MKARNLTLAAVLGMAALGQGATAAAESVLHRGNGGEPSTLDPHRTDGRIESNILRDLFEGLVLYGPDGKLRPGLAESWTVSQDGLVYTFHLRPDARWSNGEPLTSADILYSLRRATSPKGGVAPSANLRVIKNAEAVMEGKEPADRLGVTAPDAHTTQITLEVPAPYFLSLMAADNGALPVHRKTVEATPDRWAVPGAMVVNGPYLLSEWKPQQQIVLTRNPNFAEAKDIAIDKVVYYPVADASEEVRRFKHHQLDTTYEVPQDRVKWISLSQPSEFWNKPYLATYYYAFNLKAEPFKGNVKLRKALTLAVNRETIVDKVTRAGEMAAYSLVPPIVPDYPHPMASFMAEPMDTRLQEARRLFAEAGYSPTQPLKIEILFNVSENNWAIAESVIAQWQEAFGKGIRVVPVSVERNEYLKRRARYDFQVVRAAWIGDYVDPTVFLNLMLSTALPPRNDPGYQNPKYDELLARAATTADFGKRGELLAEAEKMMIEEYPVIPIYHFATKSLVNPDLKGWKYNIRDVHSTRFLSFQKGPPS